MQEKNVKIFVTILLLEFALFLTGVLWSYAGKIQVIEHISFSVGGILLGLAGGAAVVSLNVPLHYIDKKFFNSSIEGLMKEHLYPVFYKAGILAAVVIAIVSGFSEEFFFRGVLLKEAGIIISSLIFGILHTSYKRCREGWFLGVWISLIGAFFAFLYIKTSNLAVPITAHAFNNLFAICYIRFVYYGNKSAPAK